MKYFGTSGFHSGYFFRYNITGNISHFTRTLDGLRIDGNNMFVKSQSPEILRRGYPA
jgi:hypothetical protein